MHNVRITRPSKVLFPRDGITKGELIEYYRQTGERMLPWLKDRPLMVQRFPDGIASSGFYQKAAGSYFPGWIRTVTVAKAGGTVRHVVCDNLETLVYLANQACIEFHTWLSSADDLLCPDQMIIDFDPSRAEDPGGVAAGALALKEVLDSLDLPAYVKTTGSRGVHVAVPLDHGQDFEVVRSFARDLAAVVVDRDTSRYTLEQYKAQRHGRIFLDVNRNAYAQTAVAPYSVRAREGAPVSVPLAWSELRKKNFRPDAFTIRDVQKRLEHAVDPWKNFWSDIVSLRAAGRKLHNHHAA